MNDKQCDHCDHNSNQEQPFSLKDIISIAISLMLFVFGLIFRDRLHSTPFAVGEYGVFLAAYF